MKEKLTNHSQTNQYATQDDFQGIFDEHVAGLYRLAFLLTADPEKAEQCFVAGVEDTVCSNHVFREWAHSWAKRTIINNAIRMMNPQFVRDVAQTEPQPSPRVTFSDHEVVLDRLLDLAIFERFVLIMNVLERYSEHDCALLLKCGIRDVRCARLRAIAQIASQNRTDKIRYSLDLQGVGVC